jgi:hypothetical protein
MGISGHFMLVTDAEVAAILAEPEGVHDLLDAAFADRADDHVDVDQAWHCLHYLLTGTAWEGAPPLNFIAGGGHVVGDEDVGAGPARAFRSDEVKALAAALEALDDTRIAARFDAAEMDALEIYPGGDAGGGGWAGIDPTSAESFGYFSAGYTALRALVLEGATRGAGLLVWLS